MRSLKELYKLVYDDIKDMSYISGLCYQIDCAFHSTDITDEELELLKIHFEGQRYLHPEFQTEERNWQFNESHWWWTEAEDANPVNRIAFIKKLMETAE